METWFDFSEQMPSVEWLDELPKNLVSKRINLDYNSVNLDQTDQGYTIYVGPADPGKGGDGIFIYLDPRMKLIDYIIERIEPPPVDD